MLKIANWCKSLKPSDDGASTHNLVCCVWLAVVAEAEKYLERTRSCALIETLLIALDRQWLSFLLSVIFFLLNHFPCPEWLMRFTANCGDFSFTQTHRHWNSILLREYGRDSVIGCCRAKRLVSQLFALRCLSSWPKPKPMGNIHRTIGRHNEWQAEKERERAKKAEWESIRGYCALRIRDLVCFVWIFLCVDAESFFRAFVLVYLLWLVSEIQKDSK